MPYVAMAGLSGGYMPNTSEVFEDRESAIDFLVDMVDCCDFGASTEEYHIFDLAIAVLRSGQESVHIPPVFGNELLEVYECDDCELEESY